MPSRKLKRRTKKPAKELNAGTSVTTRSQGRFLSLIEERKALTPQRKEERSRVPSRIVIEKPGDGLPNSGQGGGKGSEGNC